MESDNRIKRKALRHCYEPRVRSFKRKQRHDVLQQGQILEEKDNMLEKPIFGDKYRLIWRPKGTKFIGEVRNYTINNMGYRRTLITLDDDWMQQIKMRFIVFSWDNTGPLITVSAAFMNLPCSFREAGIWHEVGHIHHKHLFSMKYKNPKESRNARISSIKNGEVISFETEADQFAVKYVDKPVFIDFLRHAMLTRADGVENSWDKLGKKELEMRIENVLKI